MPRVLLIHGFACDSAFWQPQIPALTAAGYPLWAPDLPFHGGPCAGVDPSLEGLATWLLRTHLQTPAILIGHSLGGMIALEILRQAPDKVLAIALVDSFVSLQLNSLHLPGMFVEGFHAQTRKWIEETRAGIVDRMTQTVYDTIWPSVVGFDARPWLAGVRCPVLALYAGRGKYAPVDAPLLMGALELDKFAGPARLEIVPDAGHFVNLERPESVNEILLNWLRQTCALLDQSPQSRA